jgi:hypothetical protein
VGSRTRTAPTSTVSDLVSNTFENLGAPKDPRTGRRIGTYGIHSDQENNAYLLDFSAGNIVKIDAKTKRRPCT